MVTILILGLTALPTFLIGRYVYKKDCNPECPKLLTKLFLGGFLSAILTIVISLIILPFIPFIDMGTLGAEDPNPITLFVSVFIGNALVEEFSKWLIIMLIVYRHKEFTHKFDAIVYSVFVHLGFAFLEDILYVFFTGGSPLQISILRGITSIPGHATYGLVMGFYLAFAKLAKVNGEKSKERKNLVLSILIPTIIHTAYNYCLFIGNEFFIILFLVLVIGLYIYFFKKVRYVKKINRRFNVIGFCPDCDKLAESCLCIAILEKMNVELSDMEETKSDLSKQAIEEVKSDLSKQEIEVAKSDLYEQVVEEVDVVEEVRIAAPPTDEEINKIIKLKNRKIFIIKTILIIAVIPTTIFCLAWFFTANNITNEFTSAERVFNFIFLGAIFATSIFLYFKKAKAKHDIKMKLQRMELEGNVFATFCIGKDTDANKVGAGIVDFYSYGRAKSFHYFCYTEMFKDDNFVTFYNKKHYFLTNIGDEVILVKLNTKDKSGYDKVAYSRYVLNK
jgi:RsiW-degrading membrane proteinase PrsW (M82 family)